MAQITFHPNSSSFHNAPGNKAISVAGKTFPIVKNIKTMPRGYDEVYVDATAVKGFPNKNIRVRVTDNNYMIEGADMTARTVQTEAMRLESDTEVMDRLRKRFGMLEELAGAAKKGMIKALVVQGAPGTGKSHGVEKRLSKHNVLATLSEKDVPYTILKGALSPIGLYKTLYKYREAGKVIVVDDADSIFEDVLSLNLLKAALDSKDKRVICWNTESRVLDREGIPDRFTLESSMIFLTNIDFTSVKSNKLRPHIEAIMSRAHFFDTGVNSDRERRLRIRQVAQDSLLKTFKFDETDEAEVMDYMEDNFDRFRESSLRTLVKIAELKRAFGDTWREYAEISLCG